MVGVGYLFRRWQKKHGVNFATQQTSTSAAKPEPPLPPAPAKDAAVTSTAVTDTTSILQPVLSAVKKAGQYAKLGAQCARRAAMATYRCVVRGAKRLPVYARALYAFGKAVAVRLIQAILAPPIPSAQEVLARRPRAEFLVVSMEVLGLIKPFRKSPIKNRDTIVAAIAA